MTTNVLLAGVGGQGTITASQVLAQACLLEGWQVKKSEIHGMSQRGGSVVSHVRFSADGEIYSPTIPAGEADLLIGFELIETLRALPATKPDGKVIVDPRRITPATVSLGVADYPEDSLEQLEKSGRAVYVVHASEVAAALGEIRAANIVVLGAASRLLPFTQASLEEAIRLSIKPKTVAINLRALAEGAELVAAEKA